MILMDLRCQCSMLKSWVTMTLVGRSLSQASRTMASLQMSLLVTVPQRPLSFLRNLSTSTLLRYMLMVYTFRKQLLIHYSMRIHYSLRPHRARIQILKWLSFTHLTSLTAAQVVCLVVKVLKVLQVRMVFQVLKVLKVKMEKMVKTLPMMTLLLSNWKVSRVKKVMMVKMVKTLPMMTSRLSN